ncbi:hypothetical protein V7122_19390 [Bacillus sp. JJ1532]|uniref:hypothetical protein n=1 Tax=Bacillus sp. JJ1532 TaxID=3122958 RepID=UPI002FFF2AEF
MNELSFLKGDPIEIANGLKVYPATLAEIAEVGELTYNSFISVISITKDTLNFNNKDELHFNSDLEFILYLIRNYYEVFELFTKALNLFLRSEIEYREDLGIIVQSGENQFILDDFLFSQIKEIVRKQNFLKDSENSDFKPANSKAMALLEKFNKAKEKIQKQNTEEGLSLKDIISIVATYSNDINIKTVWDLTVSQLYESYLRLIIWDDYQNKQRLLPHISDPQSLDLKHWATDINKIKN